MLTLRSGRYVSFLPINIHYLLLPGSAWNSGVFPTAQVMGVFVKGKHLFRESLGVKQASIVQYRYMYYKKMAQR